jgi:hypothetical protein
MVAAAPVPLAQRVRIQAPYHRVASAGRHTDEYEAAGDFNTVND